MSITPKMSAALIAVLLFITVIVSCSKSDPAPVPPIVGPDSSILSKYIILDTTIIPADTFSIETYEYDNQKRLIRSLRNRKIASVMQLNYSFDFTYPGNDTLPDKVIFRWFDPTILITKTHFTRYDNQGRIIWDSLISVQSPSGATSTILHSYTYFAGGFTDSAFNYNSGSISGDSIFQVRDARNNIIEEHRNPGSSTFAEYDNKVNPFYKVSPVRGPYLVYANFPSFLGITAQKNNIIKQDNYPYHYTYKPNGLPSIIKWLLPPGSYHGRSKHLLYYTN